MCTMCADVLAEEEAHEAIFQPLPFHYIEVAHLLLRHAKEAFEEGDNTLYQVHACAFAEKISADRLLHQPDVRSS